MKEMRGLVLLEEYVKLDLRDTSLSPMSGGEIT